MKTLKQIQEGFFNTSGAGEDAAVEGIIKKYGLCGKELKTLKLVPLTPNMVQVNGKSITIISKFDENTGEDTRLFYNTVYIETDEKNIPFKISIDTGDKTDRGGISIEDCPNLETIDFVDKIDGIFIKNCGGKKGIDISGLNKGIIPDIENTSISNFGNINLGSKYQIILNQETLDNTDFKNFPSSTTNELVITNKFYPQDRIDELNLKNIPSNQQRVIMNKMPNILGDIDLGFGTLIIGNTYDKDKKMPENLKEWLMTTDLKGTRIILRSKSKGTITKMRKIIESVKKKRPEIADLIDAL